VFRRLPLEVPVLDVKGLSSLRSYFLAHVLASACMAFLPHCMLDHA
jgi:hypothetical protein